MTDTQISKLKLMAKLESVNLYQEAKKYFCHKCKNYPRPGENMGKSDGFCPQRHSENVSKIFFDEVHCIWTCFEKKEKK